MSRLGIAKIVIEILFLPREMIFESELLYWFHAVFDPELLNAGVLGAEILHLLEYYSSRNSLAETIKVSSYFFKGKICFLSPEIM